MLSHRSISALLIMGILVLSPVCGLAGENDAVSAGTITLSIEKSRTSIQGIHEFIDVTVTDGFKSASGYDLLLAFDPTALTVHGATPAPKFYSDSGYQWEYFVYRFSQIESCSTICPIGAIRVTGIAETNNGPFHPRGFGLIKGDLLFTIDFLISDNRTLECTFSPIRFCWRDCEDNVLASEKQDTAYVSYSVIDHDGSEIAELNDPDGYPTYAGAQSSDCSPEVLLGIPERSIEFINGGVDIACAESLEGRCRISGYDPWWDPYRDPWVHDAVVYSRYFIYGLAVFNINTECQVAATDVNYDGNILTVADFVYAIRIAVGDAHTWPDLDTLEIDYVHHHDTLSIRGQIGALFVEMEGEVTPVNLSPVNMEYAYHVDSDATRILFFTMDKGVTLGREVLACPGKIRSIEMATYDAQPVSPKQITIPDSFELHQNYPNPFNSTTVLGFSLPIRSQFTLSIHNSLGQIVETFSGFREAGPISLTWDAADFASGVYFYRLQVGDFSQTRKMVLLK